MSEKVFGGKCTSCGTVNYPQRHVCSNCRNESFEPVPIEGEGELLTYSDVYALAIDYETRYLRLAMVALDNGIRVTGQLLDEDPKLGKRVKTSVGVVRVQGGREIHGFQFLPT